MVVSVSGLCDGASYVVRRCTKYGVEYEHSYQKVARDANRVFEKIRSILEDYEGYTNGMTTNAFHWLRNYPFFFSTFKGEENTLLDIYDEEFGQLDSLYDHIDQYAESLAEQYVPADAIQQWWKVARSKSRQAVKRFDKKCSSNQELKLYQKAAVWLECFDFCFKEQLA